jgi:hypothetical protein
MTKKTTVKKKAMGAAAVEVETLTVACTNDECAGMLTLRTKGDVTSVVCGECGQIFGTMNAAVLATMLESLTGYGGCPTFTLRADEVGHLRALMAVLEVLPESATVDGQRVLREFEVWEEAHRGGVTAAGS